MLGGGTRAKVGDGSSARIVGMFRGEARRLVRLDPGGDGWTSRRYVSLVDEDIANVDIPFCLSLHW